MRKILLLISLMWASFVTAEKIVIADYIIYPPFQTRDLGLTKEFSQLIAEEIPEIEFKYLKISKERLIVLLEQKQSLIIPFSQRYWFDSKYPLNPSDKIFQEAVYVISNKEKALEVNNIGTKPLLFLGRTGYMYQVIDELEQQNKLERYSCETDDLCLEMLKAKRGDFLVMAKSTYEQYLTRYPLHSHSFHISEKPLFYQPRKLLSFKVDKSVEAKIHAFIKALPTNQKWLQLKARYRIN